jgi:hypothetical protein
MAHCNLLHENLFAYVEKELPPEQMQKLNKHVNECASCARILGEFMSTLALMEEQKLIQPKPFAETRIMQGIESWLEECHKSRAPKFTRILHPALISVGIIAALTVGFFIGSDFADSNLQSNQNEEMTEAVRSDLNVPDFMTDDLFNFTE